MTAPMRNRAVAPPRPNLAVPRLRLVLADGLEALAAHLRGAR